MTNKEKAKEEEVEKPEENIDAIDDEESKDSESEEAGEDFEPDDEVEKK